MRRIDLHCHPNTKAWFQAIQPYADALREYWHRPWEPKSEDEVIQELRDAGVQVLLVAFDTETVSGLPPCSNDYVAKFRDDYPDTILQAWGLLTPGRERSRFVRRSGR